MAAERNPFFKLEDLHSLEFSVEGNNLTSQVKLPKGGAILTQILEDGVWVELPPRSCSLGHVLALNIEARKVTGTSKSRLPSGEIVEKNEYMESKNHVTGVVDDIEGDPKGRMLVRLLFRQFAQEEWKTLLNYFSEKQGTVNRLIKSARK